jgi:ribonuclease P protein subunit POP4
MSTEDPFIPRHVISNLTGTSDAQGVYAARIKGKHILLENPVRESREKKERDEKRAKKKKERERKAKGVGALGRRDGLWRLDKDEAWYVSCCCLPPALNLG